MIWVYFSIQMNIACSFDCTRHLPSSIDADVRRYVFWRCCSELLSLSLSCYILAWKETTAHTVGSFRVEDWLWRFDWSTLVVLQLYLHVEWNRQCTNVPCLGTIKTIFYSHFSVVWHPSQCLWDYGRPPFPQNSPGLAIWDNQFKKTHCSSCLLISHWCVGTEIFPVQANFRENTDFLSRQETRNKISGWQSKCLNLRVQNWLSSLIFLVVKWGDAANVNQCLVNTCAVAGWNGQEELMNFDKWQLVYGVNKYVSATSYIRCWLRSMIYW